MPTPPGVPKPRKPRPSRARGLRTTTGCLTCRKRRVKCDETKPRCGPCAKSDRDCIYGQSSKPSVDVTSATEEEDAPQPAPATDITRKVSNDAASPSKKRSIGGDIDPQLFTHSPELRFDLSPLTIANSLPSPNSAPFEWYDLLAEDAINNIQKHNLGFDSTCLSRRQSPVPGSPTIDPQPQAPKETRVVESFTFEPWNTPDTIPLQNNELVLFQHYVGVVGPMIDLMDPLRHFSTVVPRLAVHNVGLLKSLLAVAARHLALHFDPQSQAQYLNVQTPGSATSSGMNGSNNLDNPHLRDATQFYYETLHYLSQNLLYPSYTKSGEIIATAILISTYEMFDSEGSYSDGGWERHLRGIFWIQRSQDNNGESVDGLRRSAWWAWLSQDIWVAFRESRRTLTIWRPTKRLMDLSPDELALRIVYIAARCVDFAANEKHYDMNIRIEQGEKLFQALEDWYRMLPSSFHPIYTLPPNENTLFTPIWIHPPSFAAAIQMFHFARIVVLINQPSMGGMSAFRQRQRFLDESVETVCGIAVMHQTQGSTNAFLDSKALYAAGLCVQSPIKQQAILQLLEHTLNITRFPPKTLLDDLQNYWRAES